MASLLSREVENYHQADISNKYVLKSLIVANSVPWMNLIFELFGFQFVELILWNIM